MNKKEDGKKIKRNNIDGFDMIQFILIIISILTMGYSIYYLITYYSENQILKLPPRNYNIKNEHLSPNEIGDTIGGILNPIIGISGSILTFLAFYIQYKTNRTQVILFNENQIEQNKTYEKELFFRLVDNLNNKIFNTKIIVEEKSYEGFTAIDSLNKLIFKRIESELKYFGRHLLQRHPTLIGDKHYFDIVNANFRINIKSYDDAKKLKDELIAVPKDERGEYLKGILNNQGKESKRAEDALKALGMVHFYKIPFDDLKESFYSGIYHHIYDNYSTIIDVYVRSFNAILKFIETADDKSYFYSFLHNSLSNQELCLIFYYCTSFESSDYFRNQIRVANLLTGQLNKYKCFIDAPSNKELEEEINNVLNIAEIII